MPRGLLAALFFTFSLVAPLFAGAEETRQFAVLKDTNDKILPTSGLCSNLKYPNSYCIPQGGQAFYKSYPDNYDILVFFTNKTLAATEKVGYPLKSAAKGIGQDSTPWTYQDFGSKGRLMHAVSLGSLQSMPDDPEGIFTNEIPISGLEVAGHEIGHFWLAYASVDLNDGQGPLDILRGYHDGEGGGANTHWSCWFNSNSVMYGGMLTDDGNNTFTDTNGPRKFSQFDQYLMGLRSAEDVEPLWFVKVEYSIHGCADFPKARGVAHTIEGERVDFTIADVVRALGERKPAQSPCHYKAAFVLVHEPGAPPSQADLDKLEHYRTAIQQWWITATDHRGSLDTSLDGCGTGSEECKGEISPQCNATGCTEGQKKCQGVVVMSCQSGAWAFAEECLVGTECVNGACVPLGGDADPESEDEPDGDAEENPKPDGDGNEPEADAADGDLSGEQDSDMVCTRAEDCPALHRCSLSAGVCVACPDGTEKVVDNRCVSGTATDGDTANAESGLKSEGCHTVGGVPFSLIFGLLLACGLMRRRTCRLRNHFFL